jgi:hypothetical protein
MPPLAWVARVRRGQVWVDHGASVRCEESAFFEGTWAGLPAMSAVADATTVFGSGMVARGGALTAIGSSHHLEGIYLARATEALVISNSLVGLLVATGLEIDPRFDYPSLFLASAELCWMIEDDLDGKRRLRHARFDIPTRSLPVTAWFVENLTVHGDLSTSEARKPREASFDSFAGYKARLTAATASLFANGRAYEPMVALSSGYDSTSVAAVARQAGCARSFGFDRARPSPRDGGNYDSGAVTATRLGLAHVTRERLAYVDSSDCPEAEFLCSGSAGEDVMFRAFEADLPRSILLSGYWAGTEFAMSHRDSWRHVRPLTTAGADFGEFRLRRDFFHVPLPVFGAARTLDAPSLLDRVEMDPFRVGGSYDRPIPRRLAEEAGIARGSFATSKRAANVLLARDALDSFTPAARESIERFAAANGEHLPLRRRRPFSRLDRAVLKGAHALRLAPIAEPLERRRATLTHFEPRLGNLLLRWAVSVVSERYSAVRRST